MKVRLMSHGRLPGKANMAIDEAVHLACQEGKVDPTLRFYQWEPACLSLGYFQDVEKEVSLEGLKREGVDLVRRPTGGKAVLHDDELTYSVVVSQKDLPGSVLETYFKLSEALVEGLRSLGIQASLAALDRGTSARDPQFRQAACFSAPSWYEILWDNKKVVGSAQMRKNDFLLQHGSIPFTFDPSKLVRCIKTSSPQHASRAESMLRRKAAGIEDALGRSITRRELEESLIAGFQSVLGWDIEAGALTKYEEELYRELADAKYGAERWTMVRGRQEGELY